MEGMTLLLVGGSGMVTIIIMVLFSRRKSNRSKRMQLPPAAGRTWSNNAIRGLGDRGKGIR